MCGKARALIFRRAPRHCIAIDGMRFQGYGGIVAASALLRLYCVWVSMEAEAAAFVEQRLPCMDAKAGRLVFRILGSVVHAAHAGEVLRFDFLHLRVGGPPGTGGLASAGAKYLLVLANDLSGGTWTDGIGGHVRDEDNSAGAASLVCGDRTAACVGE